MIRTIRLECNDPKRVELLLKVAQEMGIDVLSEGELENVVQEPELTYEQQQVLDDRRATANEADFIPWEEAKKQLRFGKK